MEEEIIIVDENDNIIGHKTRPNIQLNDIYRVSSLIVYNKEGDVLLGKRAKTKKNNPNLWAPIVNGTNAKGETYEENIIRETREEIGLDINSPIPVTKVRVRENHDHFVSFFKIIIDKDTRLIVDESEIQEIRWFSKNDLENLLEESPHLFVPTFYEVFFPVI